MSEVPLYSRRLGQVVREAIVKLGWKEVAAEEHSRFVWLDPWHANKQVRCLPQPIPPSTRD